MPEYFSLPELVGGLYWKDKRFEYSGADLIYMGVNRDQNAGTTDVNWWVWKLTWSGENLSRFQGPLVGSWDNRASLGW